MADLASDIEQAAKDPRSATVDGRNVQAIPLPEMIEADVYLKSQTAATRDGLGLRFRKLVSMD